MESCSETHVLHCSAYTLCGVECVVSGCHIHLYLMFCFPSNLSMMKMSGLGEWLENFISDMNMAWWSNAGWHMHHTVKIHTGCKRLFISGRHIHLYLMFCFPSNIHSYWVMGGRTYYTVLLSFSASNLSVLKMNNALFDHLPLQ